MAQNNLETFMYLNPSFFKEVEKSTYDKLHFFHIKNKKVALIHIDKHNIQYIIKSQITDDMSDKVYREIIKLINELEELYINKKREYFKNIVIMFKNNCEILKKEYDDEDFHPKERVIFFINADERIIQYNILSPNKK